MARGTPENCVSSNYVKIAVGFDREQMDRINELSEYYNCSFAEATRLLVDWGLEVVAEWNPK